MMNDKRYKGIFFMLLAALGFSVMGGAAKSLKESFSAGQLVFWRNIVGLIVLIVSFSLHRPVNKGGKMPWLIFRGFMGTTALYTLLYCVVHLPLGTAMSYNLTSTLFIALFSFIVFKEYNGKRVLLALFIGFTGMLLIYKPNMHYAWFYHVAGLISGISSAIAYLTVGRLTKYYDSRIIVSAFVLGGIIAPLSFLLIKFVFNLPSDELFFIDWRWPETKELPVVLLLGTAAIFGQYFVTKAFGADKAGIVSVIGYANIIFSVFIGMMLGDAFPELMSWAGIACIIISGLIISLHRKTNHS